MQAKRTPFVSAWRDVSRSSSSSSSKVQLSRHSHYAISKSVVVLPSLHARPESLIAHFGTPREIVRHDHFNNENILMNRSHYALRSIIAHDTQAATWIIETWTAHVHERDTHGHTFLIHSVIRRICVLTNNILTKTLNFDEKSIICFHILDLLNNAIFCC